MANVLRAQLYRDKSRAWRWRLKAANGRIVADSAEGYTRRADCLRAWVWVVAGVASLDVPVEIVTGEG